MLGQKLMIKMWRSCVDNGIGGWLEPRQIRRVGEAITDVQVENTLRIAQAEKIAEDIRQGKAVLENDLSIRLLSDKSKKVLPSDKIPEQIMERDFLTKAINSQNIINEIRKEVNVAKAILVAEAELENDQEEPSEMPINDDWIHRWRDCASKVSSEDLQSLWGKVLAGETKVPGSFSLRTLEFLKNASQKDAEDVARLAPFAVSGIVYRDDKWLASNGIPYSLLLKMQEIGVLVGVESIALNNEFISLASDRFLSSLTSKDRVLIIEDDDPSKKLEIQSFNLTGVGKELINLCKAKSNDNYLREFGKYILRHGFKVKLASIKKVFDDGRIQYTNSEELNLPVGEPPEIVI